MSECGLCDGMRICRCGFDARDERRFQAAVAVMQGILTNEQYIHAFDYKDLARQSIKCADALLAALEDK